MMEDLILKFVTAHWAAVTVIAAYIALAFVNHLPPPGSKTTFYEYFYNVTRSLLNAPVIQAFEQKYGGPTLADVNKLPKP